MAGNQVVEAGRGSADNSRMFRRLLIGTVLVAGAAPIAAQNLADVARAEEARRKAVKGQAKVYTNETLRGPDGGDPPAAPSAPAPVATPAANAPAKPDATSPGTKSAATPAADSATDEKYWRDRLTSARDALGRSQTFAEALQAQINGLYTEFVNMSDPAQRAVIEQKRLAAIAEQDRVKADIARQTKALADIEEEARRANVPAGWLR
jgi:hypothetical protein